jgi:capsular exopolysaccharide synthesis family protein
MPEFRITDMMKTMAKSKVVGKDPAKVLSSSSKKISPRSETIVPSKNSYIRTQETTLSLRDRFDLFLRYRKVFIGTLILVTLLAPVYLRSKSYPYFTKGFIVYQDNEQDNPLKGSRIVYYTNTVVRMGNSEPVLKRFKEHMITKLENHSKENPTYLSILKTFRNVDPMALRGGSHLMPSGQQQHLIQVTNSHPSLPELSQFKVDALMDAMMEELSVRTQKDYQRQLEDILGKISQNEKELKSLDSELKLLLDPEEGLKLNQTHVSYNLELENLQRKIIAHRSRIAEVKSSIQEQVKLIDPKLENLQQIHWVFENDPLLRQIIQLKTRRDTDQDRYQPGHPTLERYREEIQVLENSLRESIPKGKIMIRRTSQKAELSHSLNLLQRELDKKQAELNFYEEDYATRKELWQEYSSELSRIEQLKSRMSYLQISIQGYRRAERDAKSLFNTVDTGYQVLKYASTPQKGAPPPLAKTIAIGLGGGIALGLGMVLLLFQLEQTPRNTLDLRRRFRMPIYGALPEWNDEKRLNIRSDTKMAEMYHILKNNIRCSNRPDPEKAILLVSPGQNEGKSLTSVNLALSFHHENNKVLLISADLRSPNSLKHYIHPDHQETTMGIVELLSEETEFSDAVHPSFLEGLDILPTCRKANNATKLLSRDSLQAILEEAGKKYDAVILDSPAVLPIVDTTMFAHHATSLILLARAEKTTYEEISFTCQRFQHVGVSPDGLILNGVKDMFMERFYGIDTKSKIEKALDEAKKG